MWHGPYLQLTVRCEMAGVWPLRIPDIGTVLSERLLPMDTARRRGGYMTLTVNEPDYPLLNTWPFLLIVRTVRIVTFHKGGWYRRIHGVSSIWPAAL